MGNPVLYFFLLILRVLFNLTPDIVYKCSGLPKALSKKGLKLVPCKRGNPVSFDLSLILLLTEIDPFSKEQGCKKYAFVALRTNCLEIVLALVTEIIAFHMQVFIIQVRVPSLEEPV